MRPVVEVRRHSPELPWTYELLDQYQRRIAEQLIADAETGIVPGRVLVSELAPVITLGRRECGQDLLLPREELETRGVSLFQTDRGGRATYHGPGQWVIFVVE